MQTQGGDGERVVEDAAPRVAFTARSDTPDVSADGVDSPSPAEVRVGF